MTVITINEDNHGLIGIAKDYKAAIKFLINNRWIYENMEIWDGESSWCTLKEKFGDDILDIITNDWDLETFNDFFTEAFFLTETEVFE